MTAVVEGRTDRRLSAVSELGQKKSSGPGQRDGAEHDSSDAKQRLGLPAAVRVAGIAQNKVAA
jgi:hypothetical protein